MKLTAYDLGVGNLIIKPGIKKRDWMDETPGQYAYRCLPMQVANTFGWDLFAPDDFIISWNGEQDQSTLQINYPADDNHFAASTFGSGIVTFHPGYLFRSDPAWDLLILPPANHDQASKFATCLSGIVETSWLDFTFTLNWKLHEAGTFHWKREWPVGRIVPIPHDYDNIETELLQISDRGDLEKKYNQWADQRTQTISDINIVYGTGKDSGNVKVGKPKTEWEKNYYTGKRLNGERISGHTISRKFPEFKNE